ALAELGPALAQEPLQRLLAGDAGDGKPFRWHGPPPRRWHGRLPPPLWGRGGVGDRAVQRSRRLIRPTRVPSPRGGGGAMRLVLALDPPRPCEVGVERAQRRLPHITLLRRLLEAAPRRGARLVGGGKIRAPLERVVGRRLQVGFGRVALVALPRGARRGAGCG